MMLKKDEFALTPPMGWNSWDCYGASVTEEELLWYEISGHIPIVV